MFTNTGSGNNSLESIPGLHKSFKNNVSVRFTSIQLVFFSSILPISGISRVRSTLIFRICGINGLRFASICPICGINRLRSASFFRIWGINRLRFASICPICGINRVCSASIFRICGKNRIRYASLFLRCRISRVCFTSIFTSSGISRFVSLGYRKRSQYQPRSAFISISLALLHYTVQCTHMKGGSY